MALALANDTDLLKQDTLTGIITTYKAGPLELLGSGLFPPGPTFEGDLAEWDEIDPLRDVDTFEGPVSPAGVRQAQVIGHRSARALRTKKSVLIYGKVLTYLRNPGTNSFQRVAEDEIARQLQNLNGLIERQTEFLIARAIADNLTVTIDGIAITIPMNIPADHKFTVPANFPLHWSDPAAKMPTDIETVVQKVQEDSGYLITTAWISSKILVAMLENDKFEQMFGGSQSGADVMRTGVINDFMGIQWKVYNRTFTNSGGSQERYLDEKTIHFTPEPDGQWSQLLTGSDVIPTDDKRDIIQVMGKYSYSSLLDDPVAVALYAGLTRLGVLPIPAAIATAVVLP
ncbi:MAG: major capsid protein [Candidatus Thermoplasmatota archaeon]|nr:major capsid protein [Candidatus Thermoplasmatota archaeon]